MKIDPIEMNTTQMLNATPRTPVNRRQEEGNNVSLEFSTYGESDEKISIVVTDRETGEVISETPSKERQEIYRKITEMTGRIFNKRI